MKIAISLVYIVIILYLLSCVGLFLMQRKLIYFPTPAADIAEFEHLTLESEEGEKIKVWKIPATNNSQQPSPAIIYFGGNAEPVEFNLISFQRKFPDHTVYLMNYRGYGGSTGSPSETGFYADALALFDTVQKNHQQVDVIGRSLGSGVASYLAIKRPIRKLILVTAYDSIEAVASDKFKLFPVRFILKDRYRTILRVPKLTMPTLLITAEHDNVIARKHTENLWQALSADDSNHDAKQIILPGTNHNNIFAHPDFFTTATRFLSQ